MDRTAKSRRSWKFAGRTRPSPPPTPVPIRIPTHQTVLPSPLALAATPTPRKLPAFHARRVCVRLCAKIPKRRSFTVSFAPLLRGARKKERKREKIKKRRGEGKREFEDSNSLLFPFNSQKFLIPSRLDDFFLWCETREIVRDDGYATGKTTSPWLRLRLVENAGFQFVGRVPRREERRRARGEGVQDLEGICGAP